MQDEPLGSRLSQRLTVAGFVVDWVRRWADAGHAIQRAEPHGLMLDLDTSEVPAEKLLADALGQARGAAVMVVTGRDSAADRVRLLDQGADDYLRKPLDLDETVARVRAVMRRSERVRAGSLVLRHGPLELHTDTRQVRWRGQAVGLTTMEYRLLETLLRRPRHVHTRAELDALLYGWTEESASNTLEVYVHHLRRKLCAHVVRTARGTGYQLGSIELLVDDARRGDALN